MKTLKDIDIALLSNFQRDILKAEAIKWVEKYKQDGDKQYTILFIKHFFNLTEEDLE